MTTPHDIANYLHSDKCQTVVLAQPGILTIGEKKYPAAYYEEVLHYTNDMMAVSWGKKKAGDPYTRRGIYAIGQRPSNKSKSIFIIDDKVWYVACYYDEVQVTDYQPFGRNFIISPWDLPETIDKYQRRHYKRIQASFERV